MANYTEAYIENGRAYFAALSADEAWQKELDFQNIGRYSKAATGTEGSALRLLYNAKLRADEALRNAITELRKAGTHDEIGATLEMKLRCGMCSWAGAVVDLCGDTCPCCGLKENLEVK